MPLLRLSGHGSLLEEALGSTSDADDVGDLVLAFRDGKVRTHACLLAAVACPTFRKALEEASASGDPLVVLLPAHSSSDGLLLRELLCRGRTTLPAAAAGVTASWVDEAEAGLAGITGAMGLRPMSLVREDVLVGASKRKVAERDISSLRRSKRSRSLNRRYGQLGEPQEVPKSRVRADKPDPPVFKMPLPPSEVDRLRRRPLRKQQQQRQREPHQKDQEHCHHQKQQQRQQQQHPPTEESRMSEVLKNATSQTAWMDNFDVTSLHKSCYVCGDRFLGLHSLVRHLRTHSPTGKAEGFFPCPAEGCSESLQSGLLLHEHLRRAHLKEQKRSSLRRVHYRCSDSACDVVFGSAREFGDHMRQAHGRRKPFACAVCGAGYANKGSLDDHFVSKHAGADFACDVCGKRFGNRPLLMVHRREQHGQGKERAVECEVCGFVSRGGVRNMRKHMKTTHTPGREKKYQCSQCPKMFWSKSSVDAHERTHTGEFPFRCHLCDANFRRAHHLQSHLKTMSHEARRAQAEDVQDPTDARLDPEQGGGEGEGEEEEGREQHYEVHEIGNGEHILLAVTAAAAASAATAAARTETAAQEAAQK